MRTALRTVAGVCVLAAGLLAARTAGAQPFTLNEKIRPSEIKLQAYKSADGKADGRIYGAVITQTEPDQYVFVQGLSIFSPDYVGVTAANPTDRLQVALHKETWDRPNRRGQTDGAGRWQTTFKTSGDFGIHLIATKLPVSYALMVWTGNEVELPIASPFTRADSSSATARTAATMTVIVVLAGLVALAVGTAVLYKVKGARMCLLIGALLAPSMAARAAEATFPDGVAKMLEQVSSLVDHQASAKDFWDSLQPLSVDEALPDDSGRGPSLPSTCLDGAWMIPPEERAVGGPHYQSCQCLAAPIDKLRKNRQMLERLRILVANQKDFVGKATALGNSYAQLHAVIGVQWAGIRKRDIEEPYGQFKAIASQKHQALMAAIETDLRDVGACESRFGEPEWYQRFGFVYYEFLYSTYKPSF